MALIIGKQIIIMLILMAVGFLCTKAGLITEQGAKDLSGILMYAVSPLVVLLSFQQEFSQKMLMNFLITITVSAFIIGMSTVGAILLTHKKKKDWEIDRFSLIFRNTGFFGIPVVSSVFGTEGVFYLSAFLVVFNIWCWSYGITIMKNETARISVRTMLHNMLNPNIIAIGIGFILFISSVTFPDVLSAGFQYMADLNTPLAMLIIGYGLSKNSIKDLLEDKRIIKMSLLTLIVFPLVEISIIHVLPIDLTIRIVVSIASACPIATVLNMFVLRYDKDTAYAARINSVTTILSAATIPLMMLFY